MFNGRGHVNWVLREDRRWPDGDGEKRHLGRSHLWIEYEGTVAEF